MTLATAPTAVIAEDEPVLARTLTRLLEQVWPELRIVGVAEDGLRATELALDSAPDVMFLDIKMPGRTGLEVAEAVADDWPDDRAEPLFVFITAYDSFAVPAFERAAVDYLLKPVLPERLAQTCTRVQAALRQRRESGGNPAAALEATLAQLRGLLAATGASSPATSPASTQLSVIQAAVGTAIHMVPVADVLYFEAADKYVRVITTEREYLVRTSLRELLPQLDTQRFWQVHRGTVVRADAIATAVRDESGKVVLTLRGHKDKLTASRLYAHLFKAM